MATDFPIEQPSRILNPETIKLHDRFLTSSDGTRLFARCSSDIETPRSRGAVLLVHGMGEHSSRYLHVAAKLAAEGWRVCLFDLRGHGRSDGKRGYLKNYADLVEDLDFAVEELCAKSAPPFLYAHSLGAQIAINYIVERGPKIRGLIAASPWLDLAFAPSRWKLWVARAAMALRPDLTQATEIRPDRLSRDLTFLTSMPDLELAHHRMSARMFFALSSGALQAREAALKITTPLLLLHGECDPVTSLTATRSFYEKSVSADKTLITYPGGLHETHNDLDRERVLNDVTTWLAARA